MQLSRCLLSLRPRSGEQVPPPTAQVARASNPNGTTTTWVRDRLDGLWCDEDFADWYPRAGRPGLPPAQLATVCVLQLLLGLSDRQAAEAARCRIDFKYAMAMELNDPGFHHGVPADFRDRLAEGNRALSRWLAGWDDLWVDHVGGGCPWAPCHRRTRGTGTRSRSSPSACGSTTASPSASARSGSSCSNAVSSSPTRPSAAGVGSSARPTPTACVVGSPGLVTRGIRTRSSSRSTESGNTCGGPSTRTATCWTSSCSPAGTRPRPGASSDVFSKEPVRCRG